MAQARGSIAVKRKTRSSFSSSAARNARRKATSTRPGAIGRITRRGRPAGEPYEIELHKQLRDISFASEYLTECLNDEDAKVFLVALKHIIAAHGGMSRISKETHLNRESLYKALSKKGDPRLSTLTSVLDAIGLKFSIQLKQAS